MMKTFGEKLGILVREPDLRIHNPAMAHFVQKRTFHLLWEAAHRFNKHTYTSPLDEASLDPMLLAHADFAGRLVQFAEMLNGDPSLSLLNYTTFHQFDRTAPSVRGLNELFCTTWMPNLQPLPMDDQAWGLFLEVVQIFQTGGEPHDQIDSLAARINLDFKSVGNRAAYYAREVVPEWRRWFKGLGDDDVSLPRI